LERLKRNLVLALASQTRVASLVAAAAELLFLSPTTPEKPPVRHVVLLEALTVWLAFAALYLLTLAGNHSEAEDGIRYLNDIRTGDPARISSHYHLMNG
jgi:hypothetical protein